MKDFKAVVKMGDGSELTLRLYVASQKAAERAAKRLARCQRPYTYVASVELRAV